MRKGVASQVFVYISALILMALIAVFGFKSVNDLRSTGESAELGAFVKNLRDDVEVFYYNDIGSSKEISLVIPNNVEEVCVFTSKYKFNKQTKDSSLNSLLGYTQNNLFFLPLDKIKLNKVNVNYLRNSQNENPLCIKTSGIFKARIEVKGESDNVFVEINRI